MPRTGSPRTLTRKISCVATAAISVSISVAAALELRALGAKVSEARLTESKRTAEQSGKAAKKKPASKAKAEAEMLERELERCWPEWRDEPFPFPVDEF